MALLELEQISLALNAYVCSVISCNASDRSTCDLAEYLLVRFSVTRDARYSVTRNARYSVTRHARYSVTCDGSATCNACNSVLLC